MAGCHLLVARAVIEGRRHDRGRSGQTAPVAGARAGRREPGSSSPRGAGPTARLDLAPYQALIGGFPRALRDRAERGASDGSTSRAHPEPRCGGSETRSFWRGAVNAGHRFRAFVLPRRRAPPVGQAPAQTPARRVAEQDAVYVVLNPGQRAPDWPTQDAMERAGTR